MAENVAGVDSEYHNLYHSPLASIQMAYLGSRFIISQEATPFLKED